MYIRIVIWNGDIKSYLDGIYSPGPWPTLRFVQLLSERRTSLGVMGASLKTRLKPLRYNMAVMFEGFFIGLPEAGPDGCWSGHCSVPPPQPSLQMPSVQTDALFSGADGLWRGRGCMKGEGGRIKDTVSLYIFNPFISVRICVDAYRYIMSNWGFSQLMTCRPPPSSKRAVSIFWSKLLRNVLIRM